LFGGVGAGILLVEAESVATGGVVIDDVGVFFSTSAEPGLISHELARGNASGEGVDFVGRLLVSRPFRNVSKMQQLSQHGLVTRMIGEKYP
jgi:hypothetical protein